MLEQLPDLSKLLIVGALIAFVIGIGMMQPPLKGGRSPTRGPWKRRSPKLVSIDRRTPQPAPYDPAGQLRVVMAASFEKRRLLSYSEVQFFYAAEKAIAERKLTWRVMAQVSLGEVLSSRDAEAYRAINSKRVDLLIISRAGEPLAAIEYQGGGHYQGTAPLRDAVKKEALRRAGIRYIEMTPEHGADDVAREIERLHLAIKERPGERASS